MESTYRRPRNNPGDPLTERQAEILSYIESYQRGHGVPPTVREVRDRFGFRSVNGARGHLEALVAKGRLAKSRPSGGHYMRVVGGGCCPSCGLPIPRLEKGDISR
jgi:hypothetical protein